MTSQAFRHLPATRAGAHEIQPAGVRNHLPLAALRLPRPPLARPSARPSQPGLRAPEGRTRAASVSAPARRSAGSAGPGAAGECEGPSGPGRAGGSAAACGAPASAPSRAGGAPERGELPAPPREGRRARGSGPGCWMRPAGSGSG